MTFGRDPVFFSSGSSTGRNTALSNTFARLSLLTTLIVTLVAGGTVAVNAGEVEHDVITTSFFDGLDAIENATNDALVDEAQAWYADSLDIWLDTEAGSYCEEYAALNSTVAWLMVSIANDQSINEGQSTISLPLIGGALYLSEEMPQVGNRCLDEK